MADRPDRSERLTVDRAVYFLSAQYPWFPSEAIVVSATLDATRLITSVAASASAIRPRSSATGGALWYATSVVYSKRALVSHPATGLWIGCAEAFFGVVGGGGFLKSDDYW